MLHDALVLGRILIGFYFCFFFFWNYHYRQFSIDVLRASHIPFAPLMFGIGICLELVAGLLVIFNLYLGVAAALLVVFVLFATFVFHRFWRLESGPVRTLNTIIFIGNVTVTLGGLLLLIGLSGGIH